MQWIVSLLLMGQFSLFTCYLYEYHFIEEKKTWDEAQLYCRENYTDLATVSNMRDVKRLCDSTENQSEAWIGLYNMTGIENRTWHWSLPGVEFNETNWDKREPNNFGGIENCALMSASTYSWSDFPCKDQYNFICYNETDQTVHVINEQKTWPQAQKYCREHYTDLVSGIDQLDKLNKMHVVDKSWIGLFRDTWRWSDENNSSLRNWNNDDDLVDDLKNKKCAATMLNSEGKWMTDDCNNTKSFFCYEDKLILINDNKTWVEALNYCRQNHYDLISITNPDEQRWIQQRAQNASSSHVWLGLRYTCTLEFWFWVSDEVVSYENWESGRKMNDCDMSAAMDTGGQHKWFTKPDEETFNFICSKI